MYHFNRCHFHKYHLHRYHFHKYHLHRYHLHRYHFHKYHFNRCHLHRYHFHKYHLHIYHFHMYLCKKKNRSLSVVPPPGARSPSSTMLALFIVHSIPRHQLLGCVDLPRPLPSPLKFQGLHPKCRIQENQTSTCSVFPQTCSAFPHVVLLQR